MTTPFATPTDLEAERARDVKAIVDAIFTHTDVVKAVIARVRSCDEVTAAPLKRRAVDRVERIRALTLDAMKCGLMDDVADELHRRGYGGVRH